MNRRLLFSVVLLASCVLAAPSQRNIDDLAKKLAKGIHSIENKKVGVLIFPYVDGKLSSGSSIVPERITTSIVGKNGIQIIERRLITKLLQEKFLNETGVVAHSSVKEIGSILGVDAIVTGTLIDLDNGTTEINSRLIRVDTGEILAAAGTMIERTWNDRPLYPQRPKAPPKQKTMPPPDTEENIERRSKLTNTQLSNENFPEGRRTYHTNEAPAPTDPIGSDKGLLDELAIGHPDRPQKVPPPPAPKPEKPTLMEERTKQFKSDRFETR